MNPSGRIVLTLHVLTSYFLWNACATAALPGLLYQQTESVRVWLNHGGGDGLTNRRWAEFETQISTATVKNLTKKWEFVTDGDVSVTPSISADGVIYFSDWAGSIYAVSAQSGALVWKKNLTLLTAKEFGGEKTVITRATPVIAGQRLIVAIVGPGAVVALDRTTGSLLWSTMLDSSPFAIVTMSGTAFRGDFYVGTSSSEESSNAPCCSFQGALFKLRLKTGAIVWRTPTLPDNFGRLDQYAGSALWGSSPPIDARRRRVYVATGNNYRVPQEISDCEARYRNLTDPPIPDPCLTAENHAESVLAVDIDSGNITWAKRFGGYDTWILTCAIPSPNSLANCPPIPGPDYDFGMAPMLVTIPGNRTDRGLPAGISPPPYARDILVVGQKSGLIWALDRDSGDTVWDTVSGPGGPAGGVSWGMATDGERIFATIINNEKSNFTLLPGSVVVTTSGFVALNASTGEVIWSIVNPTHGLTLSPPTHANGVVFVGSTSDPAFYALDAKTGELLETLPTNGSISGGASVSNGCAFLPVGVGPGTKTIAKFSNYSIVEGRSVAGLCTPSTL